MSWAWMRLTRARPLNARAEIVVADLRDGLVELVQHQLHPQLGRLVDDDEQHLVMLLGAGALAGEKLIEMEVVAIAHRRAEIDMRLFREVVPRGRRCRLILQFPGHVGRAPVLSGRHGVAPWRIPYFSRVVAVRVADAASVPRRSAP